MSFIDEMNHTNLLIVGASQGIGLGFVRKILQDSRVAKVYATYRQPESASELLDLKDEYSDRLVCLSVDITNESQIAQCVEQIRAEVDKLHLVINCVGILHEGDIQPEKSLRQINPDYLLRYFQVNSIGSVLLAKHLLPLLRHKERSVFASISAKVGSIGDNKLGGWYGYRASKAALNMFMKTIAIEYGRSSPKTLVVMLHPGTTDTDLSRPFQRSVPADKLFSVERTVTQLLAVIEQLEEGDSGQFFSWDGSRLPW
ncbi:SDR family NAD(P)-dependent oxidoreductase [Aetokthonos hydrillicola Thurmond2011]|jgi:NAD(P)-dependent dehydrogenase (short-subunit alcohol dehydrogenase family)|uniref:SDR family NAD(P)-dependent oxidoreductase n=1 Tax=Aetokthonos hydrillicola Thurmond2011 TaxID=2712845 RepID=A0AAP5I5Y4_9CYAN|nr:SDR family NAD(P)-dependent oxidoreductase [Aetokthonos hydrillicola]MBO3463945.1 SDR family NAD(P)-dependent oxidoreductase [Aetokthonos hydrillicola CCALA 1050]MBW4583661.1 SDR family NAD(P)-dependent oxidoreductase [Aetokthonos hydrillicola CCALA 1050]MDR9895643.1 SDR family NAD(P)-dependent oxidoreductase [Aetokthonos hydrillicola Thurmond2011]